MLLLMARPPREEPMIENGTLTPSSEISASPWTRLRQLGLSVALSSLAITLVSCGGGGTNVAGGGGGGGGGVNRWAKGSVSAVYEFRAGAAPDGPSNREATEPAGLAPGYKIATVLGEAPIAADGKFTVAAFANSPTMAFVSNASGKVVSMVMIDPKTKKVDRTLEAKTLAYLNVGGGYLTTSLRERLISELDSMPEVASMAGDLASIRSFEQDSVQLRNILESRLLPKLQRMSGNTAPGMRVEPSNGKGGVEVLQNALYDVTVRNSFRRRLKIFVQRTGYKLPEQNPVDDLKDITVFDLDPIVGENSLGTMFGDIGTLLGDNNPVFTSNIAWTPQVSDPITLPIYPANAEKTTYRVVAAGPGTPMDTTGISQAMIDAQREKIFESVLSDIFLPVLLTALGPLMGDWTTDPDIKGQYETFGIAIKDIVMLGLTTPSVESKWAAGDMAGAVDELKRIVWNSDSFKAALTVFLNQVIRIKYGANPPAHIGELVNNVNKVLLVADVLLLGADISLILTHWGLSKGFEDFTVVVNRARVKLTPPHADLSVKNDLAIKASVPDATGPEAPLLEYRWKVVSGQALVDLVGKNLTGDELTSSEGDMTVRSVSHTTGRAVIEVEAFVNNPGSNNDVSLGTATCDIDITDNKAVLTPAKASVKPAGSQTFTVKINSKQPGDKFMYKWACTDAFGKLTAPAGETANSSATYQAGSGQGSDTVSVEVFKQTGAGLVRIGKSSSTILIEQQPTIIAATYSPMIYVSNVYAVVSFQKPAWASRFRLVGVGGNDYAYWGESINISGGFSQNIDGVIDLGSGTLGIALSLASGEPVSGGVGWMNGRFGGFSFYVEASP